MKHGLLFQNILKTQSNQFTYIYDIVFHLYFFGETLFYTLA
jgi:hypothetical protein